MTLRRLLAVVATLIVAAAARAVVAPAAPALANWDVRGEREALVAPKTAEQARALDALRGGLPPGGELVFVAGPDPGTLHHLFRRAGWLTTAQDGEPRDLALRFVALHRALLGLSDDAVRALVLRREIVDPGTLARHELFEQSSAGLPVLHGEVRVSMDANGRILAVAGNTAPQPPAPEVEWLLPEDALRFAATLAGSTLAQGATPRSSGPDPAGVTWFEQGPFRQRPWAWRAWFPQDGALRPAWIVTLDVRGGSWFQLAVDGATGEPLQRFDLVDHAATEGLVFREDPDRGPQLTMPFVDATAWTDAASPRGWSSAGLTQGNNCDVKDDVANDDETTAGARAAAAAGPPLAFDFPFAGDPSVDVDASFTNLFWLNNWLHDRLVRMGFDEASGNFQSVNFGGVGRGGDAVFVDARDGSGLNNANFGTPPDGFPPRMQMYLWTFTSPWRDSAFDASVVTHELFHGVSNRLVGLAANGAGCLGGPQGGAMGEAWSDFFPCSFWNRPVVGAYVVNDPVRGIRRAPYDAYPFNYGDLCNQGGFEVHRDGEIWAATLWRLREALIAKHGNAQGRCLVERLVLDGMKLSPCLPTYVDMRDAILLAARLHGEDGDECALWQAFAAKGLGVGAVSRPDCTTPADASFLAPPECAACAMQPPTDLVLDASLPNRVVVTFTPSPDATEHVLVRANGDCPGDCAEASFEEVARGPSDATRFEAADAPGRPLTVGSRHAFRVIATNGACTASTACASATIAGRCTLPPIPALPDTSLGVVAITRPSDATCALRVEWMPARAACGPASFVRYDVYRSTNPVFVPGPENLVGSVPAPATSFVDASVPSAEVTYVVRAEDMTLGGEGPHGGNQELNDVRLSLAPHGVASGLATFSDDGEAGELPGYRRSGTFPTNDWALTSDADTRGGFAWHSADVEGGNADKNLHLPLMSLGPAPRMTFRHCFQLEDDFDGAVVEISLDGGRTWRDLVDDIVRGGYATSRGAGRSLTVGDMIHAPNVDQVWTGENESGFPNYDDVEIDLAPYANTDDVQIRFRLLVDPLAAAPGGWYVDDVVVDGVVAHEACTSACSSPPVAVLPDAAACVSPGSTSFALLDGSRSIGTASPLRSGLGMVFTCAAPATFGGRTWTEGPIATIGFPPGTPSGDYPVLLTVRDELGCEATTGAVVTLRDETFVPAPVGATLRVSKLPSGGGLLLTWGATDATTYNVHVAPFRTDLASGLHVTAPWMQAAGTSVDLTDAQARPGGGSLFLGVYSASDCGRSVP